MTHIVKGDGYELRYAEVIGRKGEELDEVIAKNATVHIEVMSDTHIWCGIDLPDGTHLRLCFYSKTGRAHIAYMAEVEKR